MSQDIKRNEIPTTSPLEQTFEKISTVFFDDNLNDLDRIAIVQSLIYDMAKNKQDLSTSDADYIRQFTTETINGHIIRPPEKICFEPPQLHNEKVIQEFSNLNLSKDERCSIVAAIIDLMYINEDIDYSQSRDIIEVFVKCLYPEETRTIDISSLVNV